MLAIKTSTTPLADRARIVALAWTAILVSTNPAGADLAPTGLRTVNVPAALTRTGLVSDRFHAGLNAFLQGRATQAVRLWQPLAKSGYVPAQYDLGLAYARGLGVTRNITAAAQWWKMAALQGHTDAQYNLGLVYMRGQGVQRNAVLAAHWWTQAALGGDAAAQYNLGMLYARGDGVNHSLKAALAWWQRSANQGFPLAEHLLKTLKEKRVLPPTRSR